MHLCLRLQRNRIVMKENEKIFPSVAENFKVTEIPSVFPMIPSSAAILIAVNSAMVLYKSGKNFLLFSKGLSETRRRKLEERVGQGKKKISRGESQGFTSTVKSCVFSSSI